MLLAPKSVEVHDGRLPPLAPGAVRVRVRAALTDGTDLKAYRRGHPQMPMPTRFGHEFSGEVVAVGDGVTTFAPGDAIMCVHTAPCGACFWCENEQEELCELVMPTMLLGAYADYVDVPKQIVRRNAFVKPERLSYREAAFLEPLSCVVHSIAVLQPRGTVAIIGDGAFGILHALVLRERGVNAILIGRRKERLAITSSFGFDPIDARNGDPGGALAARTGGRGADAAIECTGTGSAWEQAPALVRRGGTVSLFGGLPPGSSVTFSAERLHYDEIRVVSPFHFTPHAVREAYEMLCARPFDVLPLVTDTYPLDAIGEAFERLDAGLGMKACIEP
jgi:L-iditol 2-dehydrogenase